jgi:hypothetical protein
MVPAFGTVPSIAHGSRRLAWPAGPPFVPFSGNRTRSGVRVMEPGLSPHSSCWQLDVRCLIVGSEIKKPADLSVAGSRGDLDGLSVRRFPGCTAHQIGTRRALQIVRQGRAQSQGFDDRRFTRSPRSFGRGRRRE